MLTSEQVADFLCQNPGFFEQHAELLLNLQIPHPHGGRAVSIGERQLVATREKARLLEDKLRELIRYGEENDAIGEKVHRLAGRLIEAQGLEATLGAIRADLVDHFAVPHVALRLWGVTERQPERAEFAEVAPEMREFVERMPVPYCGNHPVHGSPSWFGEAGAHLKSFALVALRADEACFGVLALASEDAQRFYPEMGTLHLARIGDLLSRALRRHLAPVRGPAG